MNEAWSGVVRGGGGLEPSSVLGWPVDVGFASLFSLFSSLHHRLQLLVAVFHVSHCFFYFGIQGLR